MVVNLVPRNQTLEVNIKGRRPLKTVLQELNILPQTVLVIRGDELLTEQDYVSDSDTLEIRSVTSGG
jgi:sulfur carrier protein